MPLSTLLRAPTARPYCYVVSLLAALLCAQAANAQIRAESESNDRESTADGPIGSGVVVTGTFSSSRDIDWFYVDMPSSGTISISLDHASGRDFDWALYQATGGAVTSGRSSRIPETGTFPAATTGRYYLKLTSHSGSGPYTLRVDLPSSGGGGTGVGTRPTKPGNLQNWLVGNAADSGRSPVNGPGLILMGGGLDVDASFSQRAFPIANGGDVVVIRTSGTNGYNDYLFNKKPRTSASSVNRGKNQFRVFFNDGSGIYVTVFQGEPIGAIPVSKLMRAKRTEVRSLSFF